MIPTTALLRATPIFSRCAVRCSRICLPQSLRQRLPTAPSFYIASRLQSSNSSTDAEKGGEEGPTKISFTVFNDLSPSYKPGDENKVDEDDFKVSVIDDEELAEEQQKARNEAVDTDNLDPTLYTKEVIMRMPDIDDDSPGGKLVKWYKKEGDIIVWNDMLCDIDVETFSFGMASEDEEPCIMGKQFHEASPDKMVKDGEPLCILLHKQEPEE